MKLDDITTEIIDETEIEILDSYESPSVPALPSRKGTRVLPPDPVKKTKKVAWFALLLSAIAVIFSLSAYSILLTIIKEKEELDQQIPTESSIVMPDPGHYINYQGLRIPVLEDVPVNIYDSRGFFADQQGFMRYELDGAKAFRGIDVSYHQQAIDWVQVAEAGVEFAMIRVGRRGYGEEGNLGLDEYYVENIQGATENGIHVGVYFFSQATNIWELDEEIAMLLGLIELYDITYPVVFDWEYITTADWARTNHITGEEVTALAKHFCEKIELAGYTPSVYFNMDMGYLSYDLSALKDYSFWLAELTQSPQFYYHFDIWQYSFTGSVPGISGHVDLNLSFRDFATEK